MRKKLLLSAVFLSCLAVLAPALRGTMSNGSYDFEAGRWIHLAMPLGDVIIEDVKFHRPVKWKGMLLRHDKPNRATVVVRNTGSQRLDVGVAIAVFLEDGNLAAAGNSGATIGLLQPGERHEFHVAFHSVYREIDQGGTFIITAEY